MVVFLEREHPRRCSLISTLGVSRNLLAGAHISHATDEKCRERAVARGRKKRMKKAEEKVAAQKKRRKKNESRNCDTPYRRWIRLTKREA